MLYGYQTWSKEMLMQTEDDHDLHGGQRSTEVKCSELSDMVTILGQKNCLYKFKMMTMTFMEVKGQPRSNTVNYALWLPSLVRRIADTSLG